MSDLKITPDTFYIGNDLYMHAKRCIIALENKMIGIDPNKKMYKKILASDRYLWLLLIQIRAILRPSFGHAKKKYAEYDRIYNMYEPFMKPSQDKLEEMDQMIFKAKEIGQSELVEYITECKNKLELFIEDFDEMIYLL